MIRAPCPPGPQPIGEVTAPEILATLRPIEASGRVETAKKLRGAIGQVFRYAVATGRAEADPTGALKGALASPIVRHRAAITDMKAFGGLLRAIGDYDGAVKTRAGLELLALTFVRPGELRAAEWSDFNLESGGMVDSRRAPEDAPSASRAARAARPSRLARTPSDNRERKIPFPLSSVERPPHE